MIRPATLSDLPRLHALVMEMHQRSIYAEEAVSERTVRSILMDGVRRHGGTHTGSTLFNVIEFRGQVEGFMLGILQQLYLIGQDLESQDFWLYATAKAPGIGVARLIDAYVEWASSNPKVKEVKLSWTDAVKVDPGKVGKLYGRKGFEPCGQIFRKAA